MKYKLKSLIPTLIFSLLLVIPNVKAATYNVDTSTSNRIYYNADGLTSSGKYSFYNKTIDDNIAYCVQLNMKAPKNNSTYVEDNSFNKISSGSFAAARIIELTKEAYSGKEQYMNIQKALNCHFTYSGHYSDACYASSQYIMNIVWKAESEVESNYKFTEGSTTTSLPSINITIGNNNRMMTRQNYSWNQALYITQPITFSNMPSTYGGDRTSYSITASNSSGGAVYSCPTASYTNSCTNISSSSKTISEGETIYLVILTDKNSNNGGNVTLSYSGSNSSKYAAISMYKRADSPDAVQKLATYDVNPQTITRSTSGSTTFSYTSSYMASLNKVDTHGSNLNGASMLLYIGSEDTVTKELCKIDGDNQSYCSTSGLENGKDGYQNGNKLCYKENKPPVGYKKIGTVCTDIKIGDTTTKYYLKLDDDQNKEITEAEYKAYHDSKQYCVYDKISDDYITSEVQKGVENNSNISKGACSTTTSPETTNKSICIKETTETTTNDQNEEVTTTKYEYDPTEAACTTNATTDDENGGTTTPVKTLNYCIHKTRETDEAIVKKGTTNNNNLATSECTSPDIASTIEGSSYTNTICVDGTGKYDKNCDYFNRTVSIFSATNGSYHITAQNAMNTINISKKSMTGKDTAAEIPGATMAIYKTDKDGKCTDELATALNFVYTQTNITTDKKDDKTDTKKDDTTDDEKKDDSSEIGGDDVVETTTTKTITGIDPTKGLKWTSSENPATIYGLAEGTYCLSEEVAPNGYKKVKTTSKFSIDDEGTVKLVDNGEKSTTYDKDTNTLTLYNDLIDLSISKQDMATSSELPGASMAICLTSKNENGEYVVVTDYNGDCAPAILSNNHPAVWISGTTPTTIKGLPSGTYYLVEKIAPEGYQEAESILFTVDEEGNIYDKDGQSVADKKIVMKDKAKENPNSGGSIVIGILGIGTTIYLVNKKQA